MNEITFTTYQSQVFTEVERLLRTNGYKAKPLFEDTYVISKRVAEIIQSATPSNGTVEGLEDESIRVYNILLGITAEPTVETATITLGSDVTIPPPTTPPTTPTAYTIVLLQLGLSGGIFGGITTVTATYTGSFGPTTVLTGITSQTQSDYRIVSSTEPGFDFVQNTITVQPNGQITSLD